MDELTHRLDDVSKKENMTSFHQLSRDSMSPTRPTTSTGGGRETLQTVKGEKKSKSKGIGRLRYEFVHESMVMIEIMDNSIMITSRNLFFL